MSVARHPEHNAHLLAASQVHLPSAHGGGHGGALECFGRGTFRVKRSDTRWRTTKPPSVKDARFDPHAKGRRIPSAPSFIYLRVDGRAPHSGSSLEVAAHWVIVFAREQMRARGSTRVRRGSAWFLRQGLWEWRICVPWRALLTWPLRW